VDCTTNQAIAEEVGVQSYPTLKLFINGLALEYDG
jgi:thioredoxin-like negative regulator of GroEL